MRLRLPSNKTSVGAEIDGRLVGFILGHLKAGEFGANDGTGWLEILGVDPDYQGKGIGRMLFDYFLSYFQQIGVKKIYTLVGWNDTDLVGFFSALGFPGSPFLSLEREVE